MKIDFQERKDFSHSNIHQYVALEEKQSDFDAVLQLIKKFKPIDGTIAMLEIGTGSGWFELLCNKEGIPCKGLEVDSELVEHARRLGQQYGLKPNIELGNIEEVDIGNSIYDVIIANSTFEHVENWQKGLKKVFDALKPGGLCYFYSTNKFSFVQGEYNFPLYGWLPNSWRYRLRKARQGEGIMKNGIDFNQFTYIGLRRTFRKLGFSAVMDPVDILDPDNLAHPTFYKRTILKVLKRIKPFKAPALFFSSGTLFICIK